MAVLRYFNLEFRVKAFRKIISETISLLEEIHQYDFGHFISNNKDLPYGIGIIE